ncbi:restriction endonuclease [Porticoccus sp. W117]|uniref:restriction endonuclease n=1 Tax=Porticoccus sp. W117 TaxID=3054777 RepID=UPI0025987929|nr:restriction endonuclease [Porticoccus sp. W117]MDM3870221.1 restriction endonuclease [Porticoccus sp. W117]
MPWLLFNENRSVPDENIWVQSAKDSGLGPNGRWAEPDRRILVPFGIGADCLPLCHALLDLMERDLGGHADRYAPYPFIWVIKQPGSDSSYQTGGSVFASGIISDSKPQITVQIQLPNFQSLGWGFSGRSLITPVRTSQTFNWEIFDDEGFERLMFRLYFEREDEFDNVQWLQKTRAPDGGRDISADRKSNGARVMIQAKHYLTRSLNEDDISGVVNDAETWDPPFDEVIIVTSGTFTEMGIRWTEQHNKRNKNGQRPIVFLEPKGHLEVLLSRHPQLIQHLGLR